MQQRLPSVALCAGLLLAVATAAANIWGVRAVNERVLPHVQHHVAHLLERELNMGSVRWLAPSGLTGLTPLASVGPVSVGPGSLERSSVRVARVELGLDVGQSLSQRRVVLTARAKEAELHAVQADNYSWFGYPDDTVPSSRNFLPGLRRSGGGGGSSSEDGSSGSSGSGSSSGGGGPVAGPVPPTPSTGGVSGSTAGNSDSHSSHAASAWDLLESIARELVQRQAQLVPTPGSEVQQAPHVMLMGLGGGGTSHEVHHGFTAPVAAVSAPDCDVSSSSIATATAIGQASRLPADTLQQAQQGPATGTSTHITTASPSSSRSSQRSVPAIDNMSLAPQLRDVAPAAPPGAVVSSVPEQARAGEQANSSGAAGFATRRQVGISASAGATQGAQVRRVADQPQRQWRPARPPAPPSPSMQQSGPLVPRPTGQRPAGQRSTAQLLNDALKPMTACSPRLFTAPQRWTTDVQRPAVPSLQQVAARTAAEAASSQAVEAAPGADAASQPSSSSSPAQQGLVEQQGEGALQQQQQRRQVAGAPAPPVPAVGTTKPLSRGAQLINALPGVRSTWLQRRAPPSNAEAIEVPATMAAAAAAEQPAGPPSAAAQRINAIGVLRAPQEWSIQACLDAAGREAFGRAVVDPSTLRKKGGCPGGGWFSGEGCIPGWTGLAVWPNDR